MSMKTRIRIKEPCHESWDKMKIGIDSRFCLNCQKNVIDFTNMSRQEILEILLSRYNVDTCGRFFKSQLDFSSTDFMVTINVIGKQNRNTNLAFYLLTISTLILASCDNKTASKTYSMNPIHQKEISETENDSSEIDTSVSCNETTSKKKECKTLTLLDSSSLPPLFLLKLLSELW